MSDPGLVSVVLPCFNVERFVPATLDSLLNQTYEKFEIVAIDDGSSDATGSVLDAYSARDKRIRVLRNDVNRGVIFTLNRGIAEARGEFIARMDGDSTAAPNRLQRQVDVLSRRPEIGVVGTAVEMVDEAGRRTPKARPVRCLEPADARFMSLLGIPVAHASVMARAAVMKRFPYGSTPDCLHMEDYELFTRMIAAGIDFLNIPEPLVTICDRDDGVSLRHEELQIANFVACARRHLERVLDVHPPPGAHKVLVNRIEPGATAHEIREGLDYLDLIETASLDREQGATEIRRIANEQRIDILSQAMRKAAPSGRMAAGYLTLSKTRQLLSAPAHRYVASKLWKRRTVTAGLAARPRDYRG